MKKRFKIFLSLTPALDEGIKSLKSDETTLEKIDVRLKRYLLHIRPHLISKNFLSIFL